MRTGVVIRYLSQAENKTQSFVEYKFHTLDLFPFFKGPLHLVQEVITLKLCELDSTCSLF